MQIKTKSEKVNLIYFFAKGSAYKEITTSNKTVIVIRLPITWNDRDNNYNLKVTTFLEPHIDPHRGLKFKLAPHKVDRLLHMSSQWSPEDNTPVHDQIVIISPMDCSSLRPKPTTAETCYLGSFIQLHIMPANTHVLPLRW